MSLLISVEADCILEYRTESPITLAAFLTSLQVSSRRWMQRTIIPVHTHTHSDNSTSCKINLILEISNQSYTNGTLHQYVHTSIKTAKPFNQCVRYNSIEHNFSSTVSRYCSGQTILLATLKRCPTGAEDAGIARTFWTIAASFVLLFQNSSRLEVIGSHWTSK